MFTHWFALATCGTGFTAGSVLLKRFADTGLGHFLILAFLIFGLSNLAYARLLAHGLGQGAVLSSMSQVVVLSVIGAAVFGERFSASQAAGLGLAILSIWLFTRAAPVGA
ncbi:hypothetical protein [uncultured Tateyamaria sp.]|uniref:hypothetical protein n=1 Tax=uncultured Tateyamaria sp. TaxID=455651 RepID=UPI00261FC71F|nr:hypothetical protein [uncultured Tateyamaria sp.]